MQENFLNRISISNSTSKAPSFGDKYGETFQTNLIKTFILDHMFFIEMNELITSDMFNKHHSKVYTELTRYFNTYNNLPNKDIIVNIFNDESLEKIDRDKIIDIINESYSIKETVTHIDYYKDITRKFIRNYRLKEAILKSAKLIDKEDYDSILDIVTEAVRKVDINKSLGLDFLSSLDVLKECVVRNTISTGFKILDDIMKGGLGNGELGLVMGGTGAGKSWMLQYFAVAALLANKNVIYYTLEMSDVSVSKRLISVLLKKPIDIVTDDEIRDVKNIALRNHITSRLFNMEYPTKACSIVHIRNHVSNLYNRFGFKPDIIFIDYGDLMKPTSNFNEKREQIADIYEHIRGFAKELNIPVWSASQTNRSGYKKKIVTVDDVSEDFSKMQLADFVFTVGRSVEDRIAQRGHGFVAKNRIGKDCVEIPMRMNLDSGDIELENKSEQVVNNLNFEEYGSSIVGVEDDIDAFLANLT